MKQKAITIAMLVLVTSALFFAAFNFSPAKGQTIGLYIYEVTQRGGYTAIQNATVNEAVTLVATIGTVNGSYQVYFDKQLVDNGTSEIHYVASNFTVPELPTNTYNITLVDVAANLNTTYSFPILTKYTVTPIVPISPAQVQERGTLALNVSITGGNASSTYGAEIKVVLPSPASTNYTKTISLTTSALGTAQATVNYPDTSFSPADANTLYAGTYNVYFNQTTNLASSTFNVGFTDQTIYHRGDAVKIQAVGYSPGQTAILSINYLNNVIFTETDTASNQGVITSTYTVPSSAGIGQYTISISPQASPYKTVIDTQTFQVPGYAVNFTATNLAAEVVPSVTLEAFDPASNQTYSNITDYKGFALINLEKGAATINAYYSSVKVATLNITVTGASAYSVTCQLTDLAVKLLDKNGVAIPFVNLNMTFKYVDRTGVTQNGTLTGQTDLTGMYAFNSTLTGITYMIQASKYSQVFNAGNDTVTNLAAVPRTQVTILVPDVTLGLSVVDYNSVAVPNARVTLVEQTSGIFYSVTADGSGNAQAAVTLGQYNVNVYTSNNILLNTTVVTVTANNQTQIKCILYDLPVSVKVVDYFGNPISNVIVELSRTGITPVQATTASDGTVSFSNVIGGNVELTAYPTGNQAAFAATNIQVNSPTTVKLTMSNFVSVGGSLVSTSTLAAIIIIVVVIVLLIIAEVYKLTGGFRRLRKA